MKTLLSMLLGGVFGMSIGAASAAFIQLAGFDLSGMSLRVALMIACAITGFLTVIFIKGIQQAGVKT